MHGNVQGRLLPRFRGLHSKVAQAGEGSFVMSRRTDIVNLLHERGFQSVNALAQTFRVDASTIRRDLDKLEAEGVVERTHGGVVPVEHGHSSPAEVVLHQAEK